MIFTSALVCQRKALQKIGILPHQKSILKAAGGAITNLDNEELTYGQTCFEHGGIIVATNDRYSHRGICLEIKKIIQSNSIYPL